MSWEHQGVRIDINSDGKFCAEIDTAKIIAPSLDAAKAFIDKELKDAKKIKLKLPVIGILTTGYYSDKNGNEGKVFKGILTGINRTSRTLTVEDLPKNCTMQTVLPDVPFCQNLMKRYRAAKEEWENLQAEMVKFQLDKDLGYGRLELAEYEEKVLELQARYRLAVEGKPRE